MVDEITAQKKAILNENAFEMKCFLAMERFFTINSDEKETQL